MNSLAEIELATEALPREQQERLFRFLAARLRASGGDPERARLIRQGDDVLLAAPPSAPPMTPEYIKQLLADWP